jgi:hypothetical protein
MTGNISQFTAFVSEITRFCQDSSFRSRQHRAHSNRALNRLEAGGAP